MPILNSINQMQDQMTEWRQDLHKIPEIGLQEYETSKYIKNKLKEFNIDTQVQVLWLGLKVKIIIVKKQ